MKFKIIDNIICEMASITPKKSGLSVRIWSDHGGIKRNTNHNEARIKLFTSDKSVVVSIERNPKILSKSLNIKKADMNSFEEGIKYIGRNYDLFLQHFNDLTDDFDDEDLFTALRNRGEYK